MTLNTEIHNALIDHGFVQAPGTKRLSYKRRFPVPGFDATVQLYNFDEDWISLPTAQLLTVPQTAPKLLPHRLPSNLLCYLAPDQYYFDRYNPRQCVATVVHYVEHLLTAYARGDGFSDDIAREFFAYWDAETFCYFGAHRGILSARFFNRTSLQGSKLSETIISDSIDEIEWWARHRNITTSSEVDGKAIVVQSNSRPVVPMDGSWPPKSFRAFYEWINSFDLRAAESMIQRIVPLAEHNFVAAIIRTLSGDLGVRLQFNDVGKEACKGNKDATKKLRTILLSKRAIASFERMLPLDTTAEHRIARSTFLGLSENNIALVGCGSIGGYCGHMLAQAGAGNGEGCLDLYDGDVFLADNLGRHYLDFQYLGETKSIALRHALSCRLPQAGSISAFGNLNPNDITALQKYDLVIDATGNPIFSTALAHYFHRTGQIKTVLLHTWIDAAGLAVRSLLDCGDEKHACFRCLRNDDLTERFPLTSPDDELKLPETRFRCGESYQPYGSDAAVSAAGLAQRSAIQYFSDKLSPRLKHVSLDPVVIWRKHANPKVNPKCPCCQGI